MNEQNDFNNINNAAPLTPENAKHDGEYHYFRPDEPLRTAAPQPTYTAYSSAPTAVPAAKKPKKEHKALKVITLILVCAILGGACGFGGSLLAKRLTDDRPATTAFNRALHKDTEVTLNYVGGGELLSAAELYAKNVNSTVGITTSITTNFWGYQTTSAASGSGFILSADGYILTNYHVVEDSNSITATLYSGDSYEAELIGYDDSNDIAVLKIAAEDLTPVTIGSSDSLNIGDTVIAIGNPLGELTFSLTQGVVSALDRDVTLSNGVTMALIQTDCAINAGNSGGALFNMYGEVIGITNAKYSGNSMGEASIDNIGFAIPIDSVANIVMSIVEKGYIVKPYIGVRVSDVSADAQDYGLPQGAAIKEVSEGGPADKAGMQENDIVTAVNGTPITSRTELTDIVSNSEIGDKLVLDVWRQNETLKITVTVEESVKEALPEPQEEQPAQSGDPYGGYGDGGIPIDPFEFFRQFGFGF